MCGFVTASLIQGPEGVAGAVGCTGQRGEVDAMRKRWGQCLRALLLWALPVGTAIFEGAKSGVGFLS